MEKTFLLHLSAHWGDLIEQIKKSLSYTTLEGIENKQRLQTLSIDNAWSNKNFLFYLTFRMLQHTSSNRKFLLDHALSMDNVCNRCLFSIPSKVEMAEEQEYLRCHIHFKVTLGLSPDEKD